MKDKVILLGVKDIETIRKMQEVADVQYLTDYDEDKWNRVFGGYEYISINRPELKQNIVVVCVENNRECNSIIEKLRDKGISVISMDDYIMKITPKFPSPVKQKKFYLYGSIDDCRRLDKIITNFLEVQVLGYATHEIRNIGNDKYKGRTIKSLYKVQKEVLEEDGDVGIIAVFEKYGFELILSFMEKEILNKDYFYICSSSINKTFWSFNDLKEIFVPYKMSKRQSNVQFLITKYCNLNCKLCSHFSPLDEKKTIYDFDKFCADLRRVKELLDVDVLGLWGGEALLCKELHKYIYEARKIFPNSRLMIGSNGLLITKMSDELVEAIKKTDTTVSISLYPPTLDMIEEIKSFLDSKGIRQRYPQNTKLTRFGRKYDATGSNNIYNAWKWCGEKQCASVFEGKIATCYFPLLADLYNEKFGETFDTSIDVIDLYDVSLSSENLIDKLRNPMQSCKYCGEIVWEEWCTIGLKSKKEDWIL